MLKRPETFPDIDLSGAGVVLPDGAVPEFLGGGFNSSAWRAGRQVLKVTLKAEDAGGAAKTLEAMKREHGTLELFIGEYMAESEYSLARETSGEGLHVLTVQEFVEGTSLKDFLAKPDAAVGPLMKFLERSMEAYRQTKLMPDIACAENFFRPLNDSNTLVREHEGNAPILVDTTSGKTQRSATLGPLWNRLIYSGAVLGYNALEHRA